MEICVSCEKLLRVKVCTIKESRLTLSPKQCHEIVHSVLSGYTTREIFLQLDTHMLETGPLGNYIVFSNQINCREILTNKIRLCWKGV